LAFLDVGGEIMAKPYLCIALPIVGITALDTTAKAEVVEKSSVTAPSKFVSPRSTVPTAVALGVKNSEPTIKEAC
jgi:hypothetical protein